VEPVESLATRLRQSSTLVVMAKFPFLQPLNPARCELAPKQSSLEQHVLSGFGYSSVNSLARDTAWTRLFVPSLR
jgi:hypothetical protein